MEAFMDGLIPHILTKLDQAHDSLRDILEQQRDHTETLQRIETRQYCRVSKASQDQAVNWGKIMPTIIWAAVLVVLLMLQIPLKEAVLTVTKLSTGL